MEKINTIADALSEWILAHSEEEQNKPYLSTAGENYTLRDILTEVRNQTDLGRRIERGIILLAIELFARNKKLLNDK